jgi:uncharacterized repeat protein (TIGR03803 family)
MHPSTVRRSRAFLLAALAACAAGASARETAVGAPPEPGGAPGDSGYEIVHAFVGHREGGHGPVAALAATGQGAGPLLGAAFYGSDASRRCGCLLAGTLFAMTRDGQVSTLHTFDGDDGVGPSGQLVQGQDGLWYGLTLGGGAFGHGTAFRMAADGSRFELLHSFGGPRDGSLPARGPLALAADGSFYGATSRGGAADAGTLFRMTPDGAVSTVHDFQGSPEDGADPEDQPTLGADGRLYGATTCGGRPRGDAGCGGTLYRLAPGGDYAVLHQFSTKDGGYHPLASPIESGGALYGTTSAGGAGDFGTAYRIGADGRGFARLHDFGGGLLAAPPNQDGARPVARLLATRDGRLYGTTGNGGPHAQLFPAGDGTVFRLTTAGAYAQLGSFGATADDAAHPTSALVDGGDGYAYGTTDNGGTCRRGTVFRFALVALPGGERPRTRTPASSPCDRRRGRTPAGSPCGHRRGRTLRPEASAGPARVRSGPGRRLARVWAALALAAAAGGAAAQVPPPADMIEWSKAWSLVVGDFDRDGRDDILVAGHEPDDRIWYGSPTGFRPGPQVFPWHDRHGCVAADVDRDGRLDLYCEIGAVQGTGRKQNELWLQQPDGTFASATNFGAEDEFGRGRRPVFLDLNHDGWPDLYITNDATHRGDGKENHNRMFLNRRDGTFVETKTIATGDGESPGPGFACVAKGDVDGDGWDDLLVCSGDGPGHLYVNDHANDFVELQTAAIGAGWRDAKLVDVDGDGRDDLVDITPDAHLQIWLNAGQAPWYVTPALDVALPATGVALALGDFDGDGRTDVYVVLHDCANGRDRAADAIFHQRTARHWTMERLTQSFAGCGSLAATVGGNGVLLANGTMNQEGPNYVLRFGAK